MHARTKDVIRILARRVNENPDTATMDDLKKLAKAVSMLRNGEPLAERINKDPTCGSRADLDKLAKTALKLLGERC